MDTLFSNVTVVTMDEELRVLFSAFVGVTDGKISYLSKTAPEEQPAKAVMHRQKTRIREKSRFKAAPPYNK